MIVENGDGNEEERLSTIEQLNAKMDKMGRNFNKMIRKVQVAEQTLSLQEQAHDEEIQELQRELRALTQSQGNHQSDSRIQNLGL